MNDLKPKDRHLILNLFRPGYKKVSLSDFRGRKLLLFFIRRLVPPVNGEAASLRDAGKRLAQLNVEVVESVLIHR